MSTSGLWSFVQMMVAGLVLLVPAHEVRASAQRTFVASNGDDAHPCSLAQPCRSFAAAMVNTNSKGEVVVLDSAGYGPVTITKSVSIIAPPGVYAGITVFSGAGVTVDGSGIEVLLRGLSINGQGGDYGIDFQQGTALTVENCEIADMGLIGVSVGATNSQVTVRDSVLRSNGFVGVAAGGSGPMRVTVSSSTFVDNVTAVAVAAFGGVVNATVARSMVTGNGAGFQVQASSGASASILSDGNTITYASFAAFNFTNVGGTEVIYTAGNNTVGYVATTTNGGTLTACCVM